MTLAVLAVSAVVRLAELQTHPERGDRSRAGGRVVCIDQRGGPRTGDQEERRRGERARRSDALGLRHALPPVDHAGGEVLVVSQRVHDDAQHMHAGDDNIADASTSCTSLTPLFPRPSITPVTARPSMRANIAKMAYAEPGLCPAYCSLRPVTTPLSYPATARGPNAKEPNRAWREPTKPQTTRSTSISPSASPIIPW